jgi:hypothetical protein
LSETVKCRLGQSEIFRAHQRIVIGNKQCGKENLVPATEFYPAEPAKDFGSQGLGPSRDDGHILAPGIETNPANLELRA